MSNYVCCEVCGEPATRLIGVSSLPVCDNEVCYHTRIEEVNKELKILKHEALQEAEV